MDKEQKELIQVTKEIVIKFIETQRISPSNFPELFPAIHKVVCHTLRSEPVDNTAQQEVTTVSTERA